MTSTYFVLPLYPVIVSYVRELGYHSHGPFEEFSNDGHHDTYQFFCVPGSLAILRDVGRFIAKAWALDQFRGPRGKRLLTTEFLRAYLRGAEPTHSFRMKAGVQLGVDLCHWSTKKLFFGLRPPARENAMQLGI